MDQNERMVQKQLSDKIQTLVGLSRKLLCPWGVNETLHDSVYLPSPLRVSCSFCDCMWQSCRILWKNGLCRQMHPPGFTSRTTFRVVHINRCQTIRVNDQFSLLLSSRHQFVIPVRIIRRVRWEHVNGFNNDSFLISDNLTQLPSYRTRNLLEVAGF